MLNNINHVPWKSCCSWSYFRGFIYAVISSTLYQSCAIWLACYSTRGMEVNVVLYKDNICTFISCLYDYDLCGMFFCACTEQRHDIYLFYLQWSQKALTCFCLSLLQVSHNSRCVWRCWFQSHKLWFYLFCLQVVQSSKVWDEVPFPEDLEEENKRPGGYVDDEEYNDPSGGVYLNAA